MTQVANQSHSVAGQARSTFLRDDPDALSFKVNREAYRSNAVFNSERNKIWNSTWLYLGHETELPKPGDFKIRTIGGRPLIFVRDSSGQIRAFYNACPHRGTILCREAEGNKKHFQCFYHAWAFSNSGELAALPGPEAYAQDEKFKEDHALRPVQRLDIHEGFVFIAFTENVPTLLEHLGQAADYITMTSQIGPDGMETLPGVQKYSVKGNWKLAVENAMDGYHFAPTHNTFVGYLRETGFQVSDDDQYAYTLDNGHALAVLTGHNGRIGMIWEPRFGEAERLRIEQKRQEMDERLGAERAHEVAHASRILFVFPNLLLFDLEALTIRQIEPVAPGQTDVRAWQFVEVGEPTEVRELRLRTMASFVGPGGLATPDDIEAYEAVQRGIEATVGFETDNHDWSDMSRGMADEVAGRNGRSIDEGAMRGFWRYWADSLDDATPFAQARQKGESRG
jgi:p-cumate 2,3-dioxygenase alpha subunit